MQLGNTLRTVGAPIGSGKRLRSKGESVKSIIQTPTFFFAYPVFGKSSSLFYFSSPLSLSFSLPLGETMIEESNWVPLVLSIVGLFFIVVWLVSFYSNLKTQPWYVSMVCIVGWFFPFWIVLLLPLDMASVG